MKNVIINKIVQFIFTEDQLKGRWEKNHQNDLSFDSLSSEQLMSLAKSMLSELSHSELDQHVLGNGWRTERDLKGKMVSDNDEDSSMHIELIDTSVKQERPDKILIDRMMHLKCQDCGFDFYIDDINFDVSQLNCPKDGGKVKDI